MAFLADLDPLAALMAGLWLFAAGMFPVGFMLGSSCSPCCGDEIGPFCSQCEEGELPATLTVTFDGFPELDPGDDLVTLSLSSCFGSGAAARVTAPGGTAGAISAVSVTSGGSGYARLGRVEPTLVASTPFSGGSGGIFTPTFTQRQDACGLDWWEVTGVTCSGGDGYGDGDELRFTNPATGNIAALATIEAGGRTQPTLTASAPGGSGATFTVTLEPASTDAGAETWKIASVSVNKGGSGYTSGSVLTFSGAGSVVSGAVAVIQNVPIGPNVSATAGGSGTGASLTPVVTKNDPDAIWPFFYWSVTSVTINAAGSGYSVNDPISFSVTDGVAQGMVAAHVSSVGGSGQITGIAITAAGAYVQGASDVIESVSIENAGEYFNGGAAVSADVYYIDEEELFEEDESLPPYIASVTVSIGQDAPSAGTGGDLSANVDGTVGSPTFGQVTGVDIDDGGSGYLAHLLVNRRCCGQYYNGRTVVMRRFNYASGQPCVYEHRFCGVGNIRMALGSAALTYHGPSDPATLMLYSELPQDDPQSTACNTLFTATENVADCSEWGTLVLEAASGATATVTPGGTYDATYRNPGADGCFICCHGEGPMPEEVEFDVDGGPHDGVYVGVAYATGDPGNAYGWSAPIAAGVAIFAILRTCATQWPYGWDEPPDGGPFNAACEENNCHTTCQVRVTIEATGSATVGSGWCNCEETPRCDPYGEYSIESYTVTVREPL